MNYGNCNMNVFSIQLARAKAWQSRRLTLLYSFLGD